VRGGETNDAAACGRYSRDARDDHRMAGPCERFSKTSRYIVEYQ
jgi:hypothetical protein